MNESKGVYPLFRLEDIKSGFSPPRRISIQLRLNDLLYQRFCHESVILWHFILCAKDYYSLAGIDMVGNVYVLGIQVPNKLLLHCIPISVAKPDFMLHLLHNILVQILWCCVCGSINVLRAKPGVWGKERKGRQIHRGEWEREGEYEWVPVADFLWDSGRFFQFQCGINKDFPHWAAWECCFPLLLLLPALS